MRPARTRWIAAAIFGGAALLACTPIGAQPREAPLTTLAQVWSAFHACWQPPPGTAGSRIVLRFGLNARGELKGPPRATHSRLTGGRHEQRAFVAAALTALDRCTPLPISPELGRVLASRVLTLTYASEGKATGFDI